MIVPITDRARKFGYLIWPSAADQDLRALLGDSQTVALCFQGVDLGNKTVDWKHRRISLGPRRDPPITANGQVLYSRLRCPEINSED
jgi:hypothetical protein